MAAGVVVVALAEPPGGRDGLQARDDHVHQAAEQQAHRDRAHQAASPDHAGAGEVLCWPPPRAPASAALPPILGCADACIHWSRALLPRT
jgi:hypothetical protein